MNDYINGWSIKALKNYVTTLSDKPSVYFNSRDSDNFNLCIIARMALISKQKAKSLQIKNKKNNK